ncbi:MAG: hypothetical protein WC860_00800 [Candidatus Margulisiibacteriota bacterium]|jgi:hypothetical protein
MDIKPVNIANLIRTREFSGSSSSINSQIKQQMTKKAETAVKEIRILLNERGINEALLKINEVENLLNEFLPEIKTRLINQMLRISFIKLEEANPEDRTPFIEQIKILINKLPNNLQEKTEWQRHLTKYLPSASNI